MLSRESQAALPFRTYLGIAYGVAAAVLWLAVLVADVPASGFDARTWWALAGMAIVSQLIGHSGYNWSLRHLSPLFVAVVSVGEPVLASALAWWILGEALDWRTGAGGVLVLAAIACATLGAAAASIHPPAESGVISDGRLRVRRLMPIGPARQPVCYATPRRGSPVSRLRAAVPRRHSPGRARRRPQDGRNPTAHCRRRRTAAPGWRARSASTQRRFSAPRRFSVTSAPSSRPSRQATPVQIVSSKASRRPMSGTYRSTLADRSTSRSPAARWRAIASSAPGQSSAAPRPATNSVVHAVTSARVAPPIAARINSNLSTAAVAVEREAGSRGEGAPPESAAPRQRGPSRAGRATACPCA